MKIQRDGRVKGRAMLCAYGQNVSLLSTISFALDAKWKFLDKNSSMENERVEASTASWFSPLKSLQGRVCSQEISQTMLLTDA